jgi:hypothetical protein
MIDKKHDTRTFSLKYAGAHSVEENVPQQILNMDIQLNFQNGYEHLERCMDPQVLTPMDPFILAMAFRTCATRLGIHWDSIDLFIPFSLHILEDVTETCGQTLGTSYKCQNRKNVHISMCPETLICEV